MNDNSKQQLQHWAELDCDSLDFDDLEQTLESELEEQMSELKVLEEDSEKIGNPETLGNTVMNVICEQFINQIGVEAGADFIKKNNNFTLDLRDSSHIQTTENFEKGEIATHNRSINYQKRYDTFQSNFQHDENGNVITHKARSGKEEATLAHGARHDFDKGRPTGSTERGTDMDHTISAGEIMRDHDANTHLSKEEQIAFANNNANLREMNAAQNRSKGDNSMTDWLNLPNSNGQKPNEIFDIDENMEAKYMKNDAEARTQYKQCKEEGKKRSIETGKQSQKEEAFRIGGTALRAAIMGLLASLVKEVISKLITWLSSSHKRMSTLIDSVKTAIHSFISTFKEHILNAGNAMGTSIATAIFGPVIDMIKKVWMFLKQGYRSLKQAIHFLKDPANNKLPFSVKMLEVGKIVVTGFAAGGAIILSEVIEKALMSIPAFAFPIPLLGSLANLLGIFFGALISGLIGAIVLNVIDKAVAKKLRTLNMNQQIEKKSQILGTQEILKVVTKTNYENTKNQSINNIASRHAQVYEVMSNSLQNIVDNSQTIQENSEKINQPLSEYLEIIDVDFNSKDSENKKTIDNIFSNINKLE